MILKINVYKQHLEAEENYIVSESQNFVKVQFNFEADAEEWNECDKVVIYDCHRTNGIFTILLNDDNSALMPGAALKDTNYIDISLVGTTGTKRITTDKTTIKIHASGYKQDDGIIPEPAEDIYAQILDKLKDIQAGTVTDEQIKEAVKSYLIAHPVEGVTAEEVSQMIKAALPDPVTVDSLGVYTKVQVDELIKKVDEKEIDLSDYYTKTQTDNAIKIAIANSSSGGTTVIQGEKGDKGDTGASAYELAQAEGYTGTQTQWLASLKGAKGDKGDTGAAGPQGIQGEKGDTGATGPQGEKGAKGDKGDTGAAGPQGIQGEKGDTGATGPQGIQGEKGDKGDAGTDATLIKIIDKQSDTGTSYSLEANKMYIFGEKATLNIELQAAADTTVVNEYLLQFISGATPTEFTYPDTVKFVQEFEVEANKTYQVSILNNIGVMGGVSNE